MTQRGPRDKSHPIRLYVERVASQDLGDYPEWDLTVSSRLFSLEYNVDCLVTTQVAPLEYNHCMLTYVWVLPIGK